MIKDFEFYHGLVFSRLLHETGMEIALKTTADSGNSSYVVSRCGGLYIKYSTKRLSPWHFSFNTAHLHEIRQLQTQTRAIVIALVCGRDGIATLTFAEFKFVLGETLRDAGWISVSRKKAEMYAVKGSCGELSHKVADNDASRKILSISRAE